MNAAAETATIIPFEPRRRRAADQSIARQARQLAEEEFLLLHRRQRLSPQDIILIYTGEDLEGATVEQAIATIARFNLDAVERSGFMI